MGENSRSLILFLESLSPWGEGHGEQIVDRETSRWSARIFCCLFCFKLMSESNALRASAKGKKEEADAALFELNELKKNFVCFGSL